MGGPGGPMGMGPNQMGRGPPGGQFGRGPGGPPGGGFPPQQAQHEMLMRAQQMQSQQMQQRSQAALAAGGAQQRGGGGGPQSAGGAGGAASAAGGKLTESQQEILAMEAKEKALQKKAKQWSALAGKPEAKRQERSAKSCASWVFILFFNPRLVLLLIVSPATPRQHYNIIE